MGDIGLGTGGLVALAAVIGVVILRWRRPHRTRRRWHLRLTIDRDDDASDEPGKPEMPDP